ncbi:hypothetical protein LDHU3_30.2360:CDS1 [Leishmania donovani]|nr:hypothetical protein LDHU3_30.2360:CDS1 [Leishmania donovani]
MTVPSVLRGVDSHTQTEKKIRSLHRRPRGGQ